MDANPTITLADGRVVLSYEGSFYRCAMPNSEVQAFAARGEASAQNAIADLVTDPPPSNAVNLFAAAVVIEVQAMMDHRAQQDGYDGILSACSYASPPDNDFAAQGNAYLSWRSDVWAACYAALAAHQEGDPLPTIEAFKAALPAYVAP